MVNPTPRAGSPLPTTLDTIARAVSIRLKTMVPPIAPTSTSMPITTKNMGTRAGYSPS